MAFTVGIAGATSQLALLIAAKLLQNPSVHIRAFCRNPSKLPQHISSSTRVTIIQGEATDLSAVRSFVQGCNVVACCYLGPDDIMIAGQKLLIDACEDANHVKAYLGTKTSVKGVHVLVGAFMEHFLGEFFGVVHAEEGRFTYYGTGNEVFEATTSVDIAEFVAAVALDEGAVGMLEFLGDRKTLRQLADEFEEVYGTKPELECLGTLDDLKKIMQEAYQKDPSDTFAWVPQFFQYYFANGQTYLKDKLDNSRYPEIKPVTFRQLMQTRAPAELSRLP
ncbi:NmrA-like family protein [Aaosphaeria arxii CBS 175.79]|uniref:NmrA-like family protein n=1 Tax=Aaosphaeria arxii CBS 175.79 TaxID=1450172 RepID=A0A6A5XID0_9PLEO|nr:NmrA-like family protein [Aaosphaeria arxii CBS 175.79]KAF2013025.1 NmrA-like family protein [Aaosphaeria arxii CBS 175.79]